VTLRTRLTAAFVLVVLVPLLVVVTLVTATLPGALAERQEQGLASSSRLAASVVAGLCDRAGAAAEAVARSAAATSGGGVGLDLALEELVRRGVADGARVTGSVGQTAASAGDAPPVPRRDCTTGAAVRTGALTQVAAVVELGRPGGDTSSPAGAAVAALTVDDDLARSLRRSAGGGEVVLLAGGQWVAASGDVPDALVRAALRAEDEPVRSAGTLAVVAPARPGQPVAVLVTQREKAGPSVVVIALGVTAGAVLLAVGIALLLARATTRPLGELGEAAARVASGDLDTMIEVRSRDEVGHLAESFNRMTEELRSYVGALQASRDELQAGVARIGDTLSGTHDLDRILTVVLETAMASTRAQAGAVLLLGADRSELELAVSQGLEERGVSAELRLPLGVGVAGRVARSGDAVRGRVSAGELQPGPGEPEASTVLAVPLKSSTTVIGVLTLYDREDGEVFDEADLATLRTFTSQATVAVDNVVLHEEARRLSITDGLTGLWNYRYFTMTIGKEIERAARFGRPLALLLLDLDHFKLVNDVYGHQRGDAVLVELAGRVRAQVRDVDTVARYGGEEFVVVLPETDEEGAVQAAERIRGAVRRRPFGEVGETPLEVTVSVGVAVFPVHGAGSTSLLRRADEALYTAKRAGRDTWRLADVGAAEE
jgi:diguanylate cyclase (GGDEF)-like protein